MSSAFLATKNASMSVDFRVIKKKRLPTCRYTIASSDAFAAHDILAGHIARVLLLYSTKRLSVAYKCEEQTRTIDTRLDPRRVRYRGGGGSLCRRGKYPDVSPVHMRTYACMCC